MNVKVKFFGATQTVTGSKYLLEIDNYKVLVDCGLFQGLRELRRRNWDEFPMDASAIDAVLITHAHIDHTGYLPRLYKQGFRGTVYCTEPTEDLLPLLLKDSAKLQEEETAWATEKGYSRHEHPEPLYKLEDVENLLPHIKGIPFYEKTAIHDFVQIRYQKAGHLLGAGHLEVFIKGDNQEKKLVFSGDIGRYIDPIHEAPDKIEHADCLFVESTYGDRVLPDTDPQTELAAIIKEAFENGGCVLIPAFAVGRAQIMLYWIKQLLENEQIPKCKVFLDSPMAIEATRLYEKHLALQMPERWTDAKGVFDFPELSYITQQSSSLGLSEIYSKAIIVSSSGMMTGGRILHHLYHRLRRENDTLLISGYQAEGTRGRKIVEKETEVKIYGEFVPVKCNVRKLKGLSGHADQAELMRWLGNFTHPPKRTFITHGEKVSSEVFARLIEEKLHWQTTQPDYMEGIELFRGI